MNDDPSSLPPLVAGTNFSTALANFTETNGPTGAYTASINWGDGTTSAPDTTAGSVNNGNQVVGQHQYAAGGVFPVTITVTDSNGNSGTLTENITIAARPAPFVVPGLISTSTTLTFTATDQVHSALYQNELGMFVVNDSSYDVAGLPPGDNGNYTAYTTAALSDPSDQVVFGAGAAPGATYSITLPAGKLLDFYIVQDDTTAGYLANPPTYPSNYASDGTQDPQQPYNNHPNVFFMNAPANFDHFQHFAVPRALELRAFLQEVPYARYARRCDPGPLNRDGDFSRHHTSYLRT